MSSSRWGGRINQAARVGKKPGIGLDKGSNLHPKGCYGTEAPSRPTTSGLRMIVPFGLDLGEGCFVANEQPVA